MPIPHRPMRTLSLLPLRFVLQKNVSGAPTPLALPREEGPHVHIDDTGTADT